jgi:hypothetical protein
MVMDGKNVKVKHPLDKSLNYTRDGEDGATVDVTEGASAEQHSEQRSIKALKPKFKAQRV